ncbi:MAG: PilZ domain-containing protein, partial [Acidobacteriales bacterium]|nr:PilZ domain-containing protein [Terriglobales bacterium]
MSSPGELLIHKLAARVALVQLQPAEAAVLTECFRQFKIEAVPVEEDPVRHLTKEKFEGAVLRLNEDSEPTLKAIRSAPSNRAMVLYAIADTKVAIRFSQYGINVVFPTPIEKQPTLKLVRSTYLLALHEFRRYVRVPVAIGVDIENENQRLNALSLEVSSGGMSLQAPEP